MGESRQIRTCVNDCFKTHQLIFDSLAVVAPTLDDELRIILRDLGVPPAHVPASQNKGLNLKLVNRFDVKPSDDDSTDSGSIGAILQDTRWRLTRVLRLMAPIPVLHARYN